MEVRIGNNLHGKPIGYDIVNNRPLLLVGDSGRGKTTIARYLTRWWLADTARHAHVYTSSASEWADLRCEPYDPAPVAELANGDHGNGCTVGRCLVVIDCLAGLPAVDSEPLAPLLQRHPHLIVTWDGSGDSFSPAMFGPEVSCLGLVRPEFANPTEAEVLRGQTRLDWPTGTIAVMPDQRAPMDLPRHRWQTPYVDRPSDTDRPRQQLAAHDGGHERVATR